MSNVLFRSINTPIRKDLTWEESWKGDDAGLIYCWEKGVEMSFENPELAARAGQGELVKLHWTGGVYKKMVDPKNEKGEIINENIIEGTHNYLATLQGLRGIDLNINLDSKITLVCTKYNQKVVFKAMAFKHLQKEIF